MATQFEIKHVTNSDIYDTQKSLIPALKLALVEYLHSNDRRVLDHAAHTNVKGEFPK